MNKSVFFASGTALLLIFGVYIMGCGQQETASTTTTTAAAQLVTLSGNLGTGTISSVGIKSSAVASGYSVVAVNNSTGQTYYSDTDSAGDFSISVPEGSSYQVSLINSSSQYFGPVVMSGDSASVEVVMGITPSSNTDLGQIVLDNAKEMAQPSTAPTSILNSSDTASATSGVPKGAGNNGKTTLTGITTRSGSDMDQDGIPNLFDADEDNDGIRNGVASITFAGATVVSNTVETVMACSNIWADHGTTDPAKDLIMYRINVYAKTGMLNDIQSVRAISVPATIANTAIVWSGSTGDPSGYPTDGTLWQTENYDLYKTTTFADNQWIVLIIPKADMEVGDTFTIRVTYTGGSYQDFFITTSYVLTDWARILLYNNLTMPTTLGVATDPVTYNSNNLTIRFSKPLDEDGNLLDGLSYSIRVGTSESTGGTYNVPTNVNEIPITDPGSSISSVEVTISTVTSETYYICPVAESADGQRNSEEVWFTRTVNI